MKYHLQHELPLRAATLNQTDTAMLLKLIEKHILNGSPIKK